MRPKQQLRTVVAILGFVALLAGCGDAGEEPTETTTGGQAGTSTTEGNVTETDSSVVIAITGLSFPEQVTVPAGKSVTWVNDSSAPHEVQMETLNGNPVDMEALRVGVDEQGDLSLEAGTWAYFCVIHPSMTGTLVVGS
ncbi:MAG: cupredoxin domain-containing protein [Actinomycetota bacterium]|nr:cupredoxin domain-containing protein [Actinomycetota bacterium]